MERVGVTDAGAVRIHDDRDVTSKNGAFQRAGISGVDGEEDGGRALKNG